MLHLFPHWNLNEGDITDVYAFSNCDEAELFVNGESLGIKKIEIDGYLVWENVNYIPGELIGFGYKDGVQVIKEIIQTTGKQAAVRLSTDFADNEIIFEVDHGKILETSNGNPSDHAAPNGNVRKAFHGLAQVIIKAEGMVKVKAITDGIKGCEISIM